MSDLQVFHFNDGLPNFEDYASADGKWSAADLMRFLGYQDFKSFKKAISKGIAACASLDVPIHENFNPIQREIDGIVVEDYRLSRFGCYLAAMNGDSRKPEVAQAQAYFAAIAESFRQYLERADNVERLTIRDEISEKEKSLSGVAKQSGVTDYALFQNAGYRGMYNMNLTQLKSRKQSPDAKRCLLDFMGKEELAAHFFRITQTEAKLKNDGVRGQHRCEQTAETVGREVRNTMIRISGTAPENLPLTTDIKLTRRNLKNTHKGFKSLDERP